MNCYFAPLNMVTYNPTGHLDRGLVLNRGTILYSSCLFIVCRFFYFKCLFVLISNQSCHAQNAVSEVTGRVVFHLESFTTLI